MKAYSKLLLSAAMGSALITSNPTFATNGMFTIGYGAKSSGMGGVAIALPQDALAGAVNPATISQFSTRADAGIDFFVPSAEAELGGISQESSANRFLIPNMAGAMKFSRKLFFGFSAVGAGGGGSRYNYNLFNATAGAGGDPTQTLGINLMIMQMNPTIAYRVKKNHYVGASMVIGVQTFRAFGLDYFTQFTRDQDNRFLTNRGNDWSYGAGLRVGWLGQFFKKKLTLGATAQSPIYMSKFDKYTSLFAEQGDIDTPGNVGIGIAYQATPKLTVAADVTHTFYSGTDSISNDPPQIGPGSVFPNADEKYRLGEDDGIGFSWEDQTVYKIGLAYQYDNKWTFRAGFNYGKSPIPQDNGAILVNILAPATTEYHYTVGGTYKTSGILEYSFYYGRAINHRQYGPTYIGSTGSIQMHQHIVGLGVGLEF